ncbi:MAG: hypothetical protein A2Z96_04320 [Spirochaetes bacterium GWB1_48_6]|nr:MAG: hypothetical protein A2Z96_04320 [Spirochaetes bacterium GWB1_48_6]
MNLTFHRLCDLKPLLVAVYEIEARVKKETGLSVNEAMALCSLQNQDRNQLDLGIELHLGATRTSRLVSSLLEKSIVQSTPDPTDRRKNILSLTPVGTELAQRLKYLEPKLFPMTVIKEVEPWLST